MIPLELNELDVPPMKRYQKGQHSVPQPLWNTGIPRLSTLYMQEPFWMKMDKEGEVVEFLYAADWMTHVKRPDWLEIEWSPAKDMPVWATRFLGTYNGCWPMRIQNINYRMIIAEGFLVYVDKDYVIDGKSEGNDGEAGDWFRMKWNETYPRGTEYCWENNPYVWVVEFQPVHIKELPHLLECEHPKEYEYYVKWQKRKKHARI